ncbi:MAG: hypothetical protein WC350_01790 [Candidatus Micrarchaeia archaeon]|jgi:hypothetical protein
MAVSAARDLRYSTATALQERPPAKIIPFQGRRLEPLQEPRCGGTNAQLAQVIRLADRRKPLEEPIAMHTNAQAISIPALNSPKEQARPSAQVIASPAHDANPRSKPANSHDAETCQGIRMETSRDGKAKGQTRKSEIPPDVHYLLAWLVWFEYVKIMLSMGIKVSEFLKRVEFHDQIRRGR